MINVLVKAILKIHFCLRFSYLFCFWLLQQIFGWPEAPIQDVLDAVIRRCGRQPITVDDSDLAFEERLRENVKLLFTVVIDDDTVKSLLTTQTVDEVILHVLKISKTWFFHSSLILKGYSQKILIYKLSSFLCLSALARFNYFQLIKEAPMIGIN